MTDEATRERLQERDALIAWACAIKVERSGDGTVWHVIDTNKAEPEVNWPGELLDEFEHEWTAQNFRTEFILLAQRSETRAETEKEIMDWIDREYPEAFGPARRIKANIYTRSYRPSPTDGEDL